MITEEERRSIIDQAKEEALLLLPDTMSNLFLEHTKLLELNKQFYKDHKEFKGQEQTVASVMEMLSGDDPTKKIEDIMSDKGTIEAIRERINTVKRLDTQSVSDSPDRTFKKLGSSDHGEL